MEVQLRLPSRLGVHVSGVGFSEQVVGSRAAFRANQRPVGLRVVSFVLACGVVSSKFPMFVARPFAVR